MKMMNLPIITIPINLLDFILCLTNFSTSLFTMPFTYLRYDFISIVIFTTQFFKFPIPSDCLFVFNRPLLLSTTFLLLLLHIR